MEDGGGEAAGRRGAFVGGEGVNLRKGEEDGVGQTLDALVSDGSGAELIGPAAGAGAQGEGGGGRRRRRRRSWVGALTLEGGGGMGRRGGGGGGGGGWSAPGLNCAAVRVAEAPDTTPPLLLLLALDGAGGEGDGRVGGGRLAFGWRHDDDACMCLSGG